MSDDIHQFWNSSADILHSDPSQRARQARAIGIPLEPQFLDVEESCCRIYDFAVSLDQCTCGDWIHRHLPCKHMYRLAHELGIFDLNDPEVIKHLNQQRKQRVKQQRIDPEPVDRIINVGTIKITIDPSIQDLSIQNVSIEQPRQYEQFPVLPDRILRAKQNRNNRHCVICLAVLFGSFGVHRFYMGHTKLGLLYATFCWTFIPAIISLIDAVMFAMCSDDDWPQMLASSK